MLSLYDGKGRLGRRETQVYGSTTHDDLVAMIERCNYYVLSDQVEITREAMIDTLAAVTHSALFGNSVKAKSKA